MQTPNHVYIVARCVYIYASIVTSPHREASEKPAMTPKALFMLFCLLLRAKTMDFWNLEEIYDKVILFGIHDKTIHLWNVELPNC